MDVSLRDALLSLARRTMECRLAGQPLPEPLEIGQCDRPYGGVFVSLHNGSRLRGCIGRLHCGDPLADGLLDQVRAVSLAVLEDPRFLHRPVTLTEMSKILIELSILSSMRRTTQPLDEMEAGVHGIYVRNSHTSGCFLPQVATQMRWDCEQMLCRCCCDKAGLEPHAWRGPDTEVYLFTAEILAEPPR